MTLWGQRELDYYDALTATIGEYAKYEILHALGIKTKEERDTHRVLALRLRQPDDAAGRELFMFTMSPDRLLKTCFVFRRASNSADAYQRMLQAKRLPKIRRFLARTDALLPTNIIIRLGQRVSVDELRLDLDDVKDEHGKAVTLSGRHYDMT